MAGLSRSEYLASLQRQKSNKLVTVWKITAMTALLIFWPALVLFSLGFIIFGGLLLGAIKAGIDLPDFK
jgi:hypothetical protein